jgi:hypothetical protein
MTKAIHKRELTPRFLQTLKPKERGFLVWDAKQGGLALQVQPSGHMSWKAIYRHRTTGRTRWYTIGSTDKIGLADARRAAANIMARVVLGEDPQGDKKEAVRRKSVTFGALATRYVDEHAKKSNRSWKQADYLVRKHLLPRWRGKSIGAIFAFRCERAHAGDQGASRRQSSTGRRIGDLFMGNQGRDRGCDGQPL